MNEIKTKFFIPADTEVFVCLHGSTEFVMSRPIRTKNPVYMDYTDLALDDLRWQTDLLDGYYIFAVPYNPDFDAAYIAVHYKGCIAVPAD